MSRLAELRDTLFIGDRATSEVYNRVFVVSAFAGITNLLLEHKKSGEPGVYALFANDDSNHKWQDALDRVAKAMKAAQSEILTHKGDIQQAGLFVDERILGARNCLIDLQRLCSYGHFRLPEHMGHIRELLSGLGEAHSAFVATLMLQRADVEARLSICPDGATRAMSASKSASPVRLTVSTPQPRCRSSPAMRNVSKA